ncbi:hypothetical protein E4U09_001189 [Claviceps aff. purpurea]|uniref:Uncharacterized protein n=1 Tax=Claviceps aff. purpurea TaxID=1967640 RepID=A0A9P7QHZ0_9HYPO|nr:hypothetical protein E4U09_001189 [Claviceps aff. purpurea]
MAEIKNHERNRQSAGTPPMRRPQEPRLRTPQLFDRLQPECTYLQSALPVCISDRYPSTLMVYRARHQALPFKSAPARDRDSRRSKKAAPPTPQGV